MRRVDKTDIYIDIYEMRKLLKSVQFLMNKADRIIYGTPLLEANARCLTSFVFAYTYEEAIRKEWMTDLDWKEVKKENIATKDEYVRQLIANFEVMKHEWRVISEEGILNRSGHEGVMKAKTYYKLIPEFIGRIDEGIGRWRNSLRSRATI